MVKDAIVRYVEMKTNGKKGLTLASLINHQTTLSDGET